MPIYEYACLDCGYEFEKIQKISDAPARKCPSCSRRKVQRLISRSAFVLKGDGWYVTDYPSKDRKTAMKAESDGKGKTESDGKGKTESDGKGKTESDGKGKTDKATETTASSSGQTGNGAEGPSKKPKTSKSPSSKSKTKS